MIMMIRRHERQLTQRTLGSMRTPFGNGSTALRRFCIKSNRNLTSRRGLLCNSSTTGVKSQARRLGIALALNFTRPAPFSLTRMQARVNLWLERCASRLLVPEMAVPPRPSSPGSSRSGPEAPDASVPPYAWPSARGSWLVKRKATGTFTIGFHHGTRVRVSLHLPL
jgi:hypothetical protein